jgi:eukaryotic-like serine/threonine-protein kinase
MGQVWLASDQVLGRLVAIKLLRPEYAEHPETLERFRAEARHAGLLSHPHIAQVYDYGHSGPFREPYLVLEYIDGPSLADIIERGPLSAGFTCDVAAQAAEGLAAAHRAHLVHRDIKPGNLLLTPDGTVKVTDFGIAYAAGSAPITAPGIVMGTSLYMAPERVAGGSGTPASDLYSLGIVMWECLVGRPPFRGASPDVMAAHLHQALPTLPPWVPAPVCDVVARLTAKDPKLRLSDAGLVAQYLRAMELVGAGPRVAGPARWRRARTALPPSPDGDLVPDPGPVSPVVGYPSAQPAAPLVVEQASAEDHGSGPMAAVAQVAPVLPGRHVPGSDRGPGDRGPGDRGPGDGADGALGVDTVGNGPPGKASTAPARQGGRRQGAAVAVASIVVAGLTAGGLVAWGTFGATPAAEQELAGPSATPSGASADWTGYVTVPAFHGQQYATVGNWLRGHGLTPQIAWADGTGLATGTVVSVTPSGPVPAGSTVTVTIAWDSATPPPGGILALRPGAGPGTSTVTGNTGPTGGTGSHGTPSASDSGTIPTPTGTGGPSSPAYPTAGPPSTTPVSPVPTGGGSWSPGTPALSPSFCVLPGLCYPDPWAREAPQYGDQEGLVGGDWIWREDHALQFEGHGTVDRVP